MKRCGRKRAEALGEKAAKPGRWRVRATIGAAAVAVLLLIGVGRLCIHSANLHDGRENRATARGRLRRSRNAKQERRPRQKQSARKTRLSDNGWLRRSRNAKRRRSRNAKQERRPRRKQSAKRRKERRRTDEAETKRKADEAERQRLAALKVQEDRRRAEAEAKQGETRSRLQQRNDEHTTTPVEAYVIVATLYS